MEIHELTERQSTLDTGVYLPVDDGDVTQKIDYPRLAQAIIEQYTASSLGGSYRSIKTALDAIKTTVDGKVNTSDVVNNVVTTAAGKVLDARQGKTLNDVITTLNTNKAESYYASTVTEMCTIMQNAPAGKACFLVITSTIASAIFGSSSMAKGYFTKMSNTQADMMMYVGIYGAGFFCRYNFSSQAVEGNVIALPTRTEMDQFSTSRTFTPHLYDNNTKLREFADIGHYYKFGKITIGWISGNNLDFSGITTMMQFRNWPCATVLGGSVYFGGYTNTNGGNITIQASTNGYMRPNIKSSNFNDPTATGYTTILFIGTDT